MGRGDDLFEGSRCDIDEKLVRMLSVLVEKHKETTDI
jgi:hypothetical protein